MRVGILETFDAAHRHESSAGVHGHTYTVEVVIQAGLNDGMVVDFRDLKKTVKKVLAGFDHKDLSVILPDTGLAGVGQAVLAALKSEQTGVHKVKVWEGRDLWTENG